ncbi:MAG: hypothetical protein WED07_08620 [Candidatus Freyarchaeum deiterrae]
METKDKNEINGKKQQKTEKNNEKKALKTSKSNKNPPKKQAYAFIKENATRKPLGCGAKITSIDFLTK